LVCLAQSLFLIVVGSVVMIGVTTAMVKILARDATQLAIAFRACQYGATSPTIVRVPKGVGQRIGLMRAVCTLLFDLLAAASLVSLSGYITWNAAF
jgi:hypothetical protein